MTKFVHKIEKEYFINWKVKIGSSVSLNLNKIQIIAQCFIVLIIIVSIIFEFSSKESPSERFFLILDLF